MLKEDLPEVQQTLRVLHAPFPTTIENKVAQKSVLVNDCRWVEPQVAEVFALNLLQGDTANLFKQPNSIAISQAAAKTLFGDQDPIGQSLTIKDNQFTNGEEENVVVTGVYEDYSANSTFRFQYLINIESLRSYQNDFNRFMEGAGFEEYVVVRENAAFTKVDDYLKKICDQLQKENAQYVSNVFAIPVKLTDLHFNNEVTWDFTGTVGSKKSLMLLSLVALLILVIACINYMNLATAKATLRGKEVAIRKTLGSSRKSLIFQFFTESLILAVTSTFLAVVLATSFLPYFNGLSGKQFQHTDLLKPNVLIVFFGVMIFATLAGGSYPAFLLSAFKPLRALRGMVIKGRGSEFVRRFLVTVQYAMALALLLFAIVTIRQTNLMHNSKLNAYGDQVMILRFGSTKAPYEKFFALRDALMQDPEITSVSIGDICPRLPHWGKATPSLNIPELGQEKYNWNQMLTDFDFVKLFNLTIVAGRDFDPGNVADSSSLIVNEAAVRALGKTNEEIIGKIAAIQLGRDADGRPVVANQKIIGVVKDFPYETMRMKIQPLTLFPNPNLAGYREGTMVYVKLPKGKVQEKIAKVQSLWDNFFPGTGLQYYFVNEIFGRMYKSEMTTSSIFSGFCILALLITVCGLYGLATFSTECRTKEIGIRKIHGASIAQISWLLFSSFMKIFFVASIIVIPICHIFLQNWLSAFEYRTPLNVSLYGLGIALVLAVTVLTVSLETIKAALANPAKSLRQD
jgi:putative ABC transport system permease protein